MSKVWPGQQPHLAHRATWSWGCDYGELQSISEFGAPGPCWTLVSAAGGQARAMWHIPQLSCTWLAPPPLDPCNASPLPPLDPHWYHHKTHHPMDPVWEKPSGLDLAKDLEWIWYPRVLCKQFIFKRSLPDEAWYCSQYLSKGVYWSTEIKGQKLLPQLHLQLYNTHANKKPGSQIWHRKWGIHN